MEDFVNFVKNAQGLSDIEKKLVDETREILKSIRNEVLAEVKQDKADINSGGLLVAMTRAVPTYNQSSPEIIAASANFRSAMFHRYKTELAQNQANSAANPQQTQSVSVN
jgi:hypothetical protein